MYEKYVSWLQFNLLVKSLFLYLFISLLLYEIVMFVYLTDMANIYLLNYGLTQTWHKATLSLNQII